MSATIYHVYSRGGAHFFFVLCIIMLHEEGETKYIHVLRGPRDYLKARGCLILK